MKSIYIKIWPELEGYLPTILPWQNLKTEKGDSIFLDFTDCTTVLSSALIPLLIKTIKLFVDNESQKNWETHREIINETFEKITKMNFFNILSKYTHSESLLGDNLFCDYSDDIVIRKDKLGNEIHSIPIFHIECSKSVDRRAILKDLRVWISSYLEDYFNEYDFNLTQLKLILNEIAKNSADHTNDNAFLGIDIVKNIDNSKIKVLFSIGDLGIGINKNIKENLSKDILERYNYWDLTQTYRQALNKGFTTKMESINNKGAGMSIIMQGAKKIGLEISVFDARSRGILTEIESLTHSDIRKHFFDTGKPVGFFYNGQLYADRV